MPNFAYANQTNFRPFSYQEMLAPVLMSTQAHQALEDAYSELDTQANAVGALANETNDPIAYARYKTYEDSLRKQADSLAKNGLTPGARKSLLDIKGQYAKDIVPIQNAITRRRELADEQRKALLQNPTLMFQRDLNSINYDSSLDRFLENPNYDYGQQYSGALLTQQVATAASNLAKELTSYGNGKRLDAFTKTFIQRHGYTKEQVLDAINNPNRAESQPVLNAIVEQATAASKVPEWANSSTLKSAYNYARMGLWSAIGQTQVAQYEDYGARLAAQEAMQKRLMKAQKEQQKELTGDYPNNPTPVFGKKEKEEMLKKIEKYNHFFYTKNGRTYMTQAGLREYYKGSNNKKVMMSPGGTSYWVSGKNPTEFRKLIDSLGGSIYFKNGKMQPGNLGNLWLSTKRQFSDGNAVMMTEYKDPIKKEDAEDFKRQVLEAARQEKTLYGVAINPMTGKLVPTGDDLSLRDFGTDNYSITSKDNSTAGRTIMILNKKTSEVKRYKAPAGIHYTAEIGSSNALDNMKSIEDVLHSGKLNGKILTDRQEAILKDEYRYYSNMYGMINSQVGLNHSLPTQGDTPTSW